MSADYWTLCTLHALFPLAPTTLKIGSFYYSCLVDEEMEGKRDPVTFPS